MEKSLDHLYRTKTDIGHTHSDSELLSLSFNKLTGKPTTLAGYGITDAGSVVHTHAGTDITSAVSLANYATTAGALPASTGNYGTFEITGTAKSGYSGLHFAAVNKTLMMNTSSVSCGVWNDAINSWEWYFDPNGILQAGTVPWARLSNKPTTLAGYGITDSPSTTGATFTGQVSATTITATSSSSATANLGGGISSSWAGTSTYPTLYSSANDRWVMHINPHISYTAPGVNGFTGSMTGATVRMASDPAGTTYWDVGVGVCSVGADKFAIGRNGVALLSITSGGVINANVSSATTATTSNNIPTSDVGGNIWIS